MLGAGGALAVAFQATLAALFTLSPVERILLGICAFLVVLAAIIAASKRASGKEPTVSLTKGGVQKFKRSQVGLLENKREREELRRRNASLESDKETLQRRAQVTSDELHVAKQKNEQFGVEVERLRSIEQRFAEQLGVVTSLEAEIELLKSEVGQSGGAAAGSNTLEEKLARGADLSNDQVGDEELKKLCRQLAEDLHQFLEDYAIGEADRAEAMSLDFALDVLRADTDTMREFRKRLKPRVMGTLAELKRRGWWREQDFDLSEWEAVERLMCPPDLQLIADRLERLGYGV